MNIFLKLLAAIVICLLSLGIIYLIFIIVYSMITEFKPDHNEPLILEEKGNEFVSGTNEICLLTWNIGYGGLGKEMDFFYEGGKMVRPSESLNKKYIRGIVNEISNIEKPDFILLQELDFDSKRSHGINQGEIFRKAMPEYNFISTFNYKSAFVPIPFLNPMGRVNSGIATLSYYRPTKANRVATPGAYRWPTRLYMPKRCFLISRYEVQNNKELIIVNIHNSAFDDAEHLRNEELTLLKMTILKEFEKGNYVIVGGDWNQNPPNSDLKHITKYKTRKVWPISEDYLPTEWKWAYDHSLPTNRDVHESFDKSETECSILDYFVTSPNIEIISTKVIDFDFENSDHQPVIITITLK